MGYYIEKTDINNIMKTWTKEYTIYAPISMSGKGAFSDTDSVRYGEIQEVGEIEYNLKSDFSFKEILLPISQTLFYFTEEEIKEAESPKKGAIIFLRSCDLHAVKRMDEIYLNNSFEDFYYKRVREKVKFILMGCQNSYEYCFCVSMGTNQIDSYDAAMEPYGEGYCINNKLPEWEELFSGHCKKKLEETPSYVTENIVQVHIPNDLTIDIVKSEMWTEYDSRCINCGRCNFVCPTCTCFTMQDIFYTDNGKVGERRRVAASCMVDGYTEVAGGGAYRKKNGQRMRFKVLHKVYDYKKRFGYHMCVGCGRCDDVCPEYISFSNCINKLKGAMAEVKKNA